MQRSISGWTGIQIRVSGQARRCGSDDCGKQLIPVPVSSTHCAVSAFPADICLIAWDLGKQRRDVVRGNAAMMMNVDAPCGGR